MATSDSEDGDIGFQIAPMVDVVFVLILFFMAVVGSHGIERELGLNLPGGPAPKQQDGKPPRAPIVIEISAEGQVSMNKQNFGSATDKNLTSLRTWFKKTQSEFGHQDPVVIHPSLDAKHERVMDVLNAASASGVKNLSFG